VARILPKRETADEQARRELGRDVLQRMHREVRPPLEQRLFDFLDEEPLAANRGESPILNAIAGRRERDLLDTEPRMHLDQLGHERARLRERQGALAGGDSDGRHAPSLTVRGMGSLMASSESSSPRYGMDDAVSSS